MSPAPPIAASAKALEQELLALHAASFGWALSCCGRNRDEAHEVLQRAYLKVFSGAVAFEARSTLRTWFFGVIRLTAMEQRRRRFRDWFRVREVQDESTLDADPSASENIAAREKALAIAEALSALPERQREAMHLTFYEGLTLREAAEIMGISLGSASQHYERGKQKLSQLLLARGLP